MILIDSKIDALCCQKLVKKFVRVHPLLGALSVSKASQNNRQKYFELHVLKLLAEIKYYVRNKLLQKPTGATLVLLIINLIPDNFIFMNRLHLAT